MFYLIINLLDRYVFKNAFSYVYELFSELFYVLVLMLCSFSEVDEIVLLNYCDGWFRI